MLIPIFAGFDMLKLHLNESFKCLDFEPDKAVVSKKP